MSAELRERVDAEAERTGVTRTAWIVNACWKVLAVEAPDAAAPRPGKPKAKRTPKAIDSQAPGEFPDAHVRRASARPARKPCPSCGSLGGHQRGCPKALASGR